MNRMLVATGFFVSVVLLLNGCCCPTHMYTPSCGTGCGYGCGTACGAPAAGGCETCGSCPTGGCGHWPWSSLACGLGCGSGGCGEIYWGEWMSDPPAPCDPCDNCGNWTGGGGSCGSCGSCGSSGSCGGHCGSWLCNLFSPCPLLWGNRYSDAGPMGMTMAYDGMAYDGGYEVNDDGAMIVPEGEEVVAPQQSSPAPAKQPTPAKRSEARRYIPRSATAGNGTPHYRTSGSTVVNRTHTMPNQLYNSSGQSFAMPNQNYVMRGQTYAAQDETYTTQDDSYTTQGQTYTMQGQPYMMQGQTRSAATQAQRPKRQVTYGALR